jgi:hypothetical protein
MNDFNLEVAILLCTDCAEVDVGDIGDLVGGEGLGGFVDLVGDALGRWCTVGQVVLDTEVLVRTCSLLVEHAPQI